jgi:hypothetical protein
MITENKICVFCKIELPLSSFPIARKNKDRHVNRCNKCWYSKYGKKYYSGYIKKNPWRYSLQAAKARCRRPEHRSYLWYGGRGIKCFLSSADVRFIWDRDKAHLLKSPSLDRINNDGNYELSNCRFIEFKENHARRIFKKSKYPNPKEAHING